MKVIWALVSILIVQSASALPFQIQPMGQKNFVRVVVDPEQQGQLDLLFVVDNSGSMENHQTNLARHLGAVIGGLDKTANLHAAVITTDFWSDKGKFVDSTGEGVLSGSLPDFASLLAGRIMVGVNGESTEEVFRPILSALTPPLSDSTNAGFLRPNARLGVFLVTDAEDQGPLNAQDFYSQPLNIKGQNTSLISMFALLAHAADGNCVQDEVNQDPVKIDKALSLAHGRSMSLCSTEYAKDLKAIGLKLGEGYNSILLPLPAQPQTIAVTYGTQVLTPGDVSGGWVYDSTKNQILIGESVAWSTQPAGTKLEVLYIPVGW